MRCAIVLTRQQRIIAPSSVFIPDLAVGWFNKALLFRFGNYVPLFNLRSNCERTCSLVTVCRSRNNCGKVSAIRVCSYIAGGEQRDTQCYHVFLNVSSWPSVWSGGQSSWLQIRRSRVRFPGTTRRKKKSSGSETGSTKPREYNWGATWKK
jgi:hypothetical protein